MSRDGVAFPSEILIQKGRSVHQGAAGGPMLHDQSTSGGSVLHLEG